MAKKIDVFLCPRVYI